MSLAACASPASVSFGKPPAMMLRHAGSGSRIAHASQANIYVANNLSNTVTVYSLSTGQLVKTISQGILAPRAVTFDSFNNLYVLNSPQRRPPVHANVAVYPLGSSSPSRTIVDRISDPISLAIGPNNRVYVGNVGIKAHRGVRIYAARTGELVAAIRSGIDDPGFIEAFAFGKTGTLFVAAYSPAGQWAVLAYAPHTWTPFQALAQSQPPEALAIDASNELLVGEDKAIAEYAPGASSPFRMITQGVGDVAAIALDPVGNLYVANFGYKSNSYNDASISVYSADRTLVRSITNGISQPLRLFVDSSGNLYVANWGNNTIAVYASGASSPSMTITKDVKGPLGIALGP